MILNFNYIDFAYIATKYQACYDSCFKILAQIVKSLPNALKYCYFKTLKDFFFCNDMQNIVKHDMIIKVE